MLEYHTDFLARFAQLTLAQLRHIATVYDHLPLGRTLEHVYAAYERRLAGTRQSDNTVDLACLYREVYTLQSMHGSVFASVCLFNSF